MASKILKNQKIYMGQHKLTSHLNAAAIEYAAELQENTTYGQDVRTHQPGLKRVSASISGFVDTSAVVDKALFDRIGASAVPMTLLQGASAGSVAHFFDAVQADYQPGASVGEILQFSSSANGAGALVRGVLAETETALTETANGTARNLGAVAAGKRAYAALHVISASAGDTLDVTIDSDSSNDFTGAETERLAFDQITDVGSQIVYTDASAITDTWWRPVLTVGGTDPSFEFILVMGIV